MKEFHDSPKIKSPNSSINKLPFNKLPKDSDNPFKSLDEPFKYPLTVLELSNISSAKSQAHSAC